MAHLTFEILGLVILKYEITARLQHEIWNNDTPLIGPQTYIKIEAISRNLFLLSNLYQNWRSKTTYLVKMKGIRWPKCMASDEGPLPV